jgi:acetyltransferase
VRLVRADADPDARYAILPYPAQLERAVEWRDRALTLRPIRPEDETLHREFLERVTPEDMHMRFFSSRRVLAHSELARLVQIDYAREMALVAVTRESDSPAEILGVARAACDPDNVEAELGLLVRSDLKGQGLGTLLLGALIDWLRGHGTRRLVGDVLKDNARMRKLMLATGFSSAEDARDPGVVHFGIDLVREPIESRGEGIEA